MLISFLTLCNIYNKTILIMEEFNYRKFLVENKLTRNSRLLSEGRNETLRKMISPKIGELKAALANKEQKDMKLDATVDISDYLQIPGMTYAGIKSFNQDGEVDSVLASMKSTEAMQEFTSTETLSEPFDIVSRLVDDAEWRELLFLLPHFGASNAEVENLIKSTEAIDMEMDKSTYQDEEFVDTETGEEYIQKRSYNPVRGTTIATDLKKKI